MTDKSKYCVAEIKNYFGNSGERGTVVGEFRTIDFARRSESQMYTKARKMGICGYLGIFLKNKLLEEL